MQRKEEMLGLSGKCVFFAAVVGLWEGGSEQLRLQAGSVVWGWEEASGGEPWRRW